ncbi:MAG: hypothetical protein Q7K26_00920 [bacterium]|nr:hypothetical protein [bacterium]
MIKNTIVILAILAVGAILFRSNRTFESKGDTPTSNIADYFPSLSVPTLSLPGSEQALASEAWTIFQNYLAFAKAHNLSGIRSLSHQISNTCNDSRKEAECFTLMDSVYSFASLYKSSDFYHIQSDERQIVMYTDGPTVAILYFTRNTEEIKVLGMRFCLEGEATIGTCIVADQIKNDSDGDGWWDGVESLFYSNSSK